MTLPLDQPLTPARLPSGRWAKGQSGNPKGRENQANSLAARVQTLTRNGQDIIAFLLSVLAGEATGIVRLGGKGKWHDAPASLADRLHAAEILLDRGWGKPGQSLALSGQVDHLHSLATWSLEDLDALVVAKDRLMASGWKPPAELAPGAVVEGEVVDSDADMGDEKAVSATAAHADNRNQDDEIETHL